MSFFDSVKKSLGISKDKQASTSSAPGPKFQRFDVTFTAEKLGIGISKYSGMMPHLPSATAGEESERSCPIVTNFDARAFDVQPGDLIVALEGNPISSFDDFTTIVKAIGRPVRISFMRKLEDRNDATGDKHPVIATSSTNASSSGNGASSGGGSAGGSTSSLSSMNPMGIFRSMGGSKPAPAAAVVLSEEEKQLRRERLSAAAQDRSKTWDKKLGQKKKPSASNMEITYSSATAADDENTHAETERAIRKTKELEVKIEQQMGYSPFRPHMSFASGSASAAGATAGQGQGQQLGTVQEGQQEQVLAEEVWAEEALVAEVDDAFAMLLSLGEAEQELGRVAVVTVSKMIQNLHSSPEDLKLRSIRVSNKAFQSKVAGVPGGAELLVAAGYEYRTCTAGAGTGTGAASAAGTSYGTGATGASEEDQEELYLVHSMSSEGRSKLRYTLSRIQELLESVGGGTTSPRSPKPPSS